MLLIGVNIGGEMGWDEAGWSWVGVREKLKHSKVVQISSRVEK